MANPNNPRIISRKKRTRILKGTRVIQDHQIIEQFEATEIEEEWQETGVPSVEVEQEVTELTSPTLWSRIRKNWKLYVTLMTIPMMAAGVSTNLLSDLVKLIGGKLYDWMLAPLFGHEKTATLVAAAFHDYMANVSPDLHVVIIQSLL